MALFSLRNIVTPRKMLDFLLPPRCTLCRSKIVEHGHLCAECWVGLTPIAEPKCSQCAVPFAFNGDGENICGSCLSTPPAFDAANAAVVYAGKGRDLVLALKHGSMFSAVPVMARMMSHQVLLSRSDHTVNRSYDLIVPVPLHWSRLLKRRFNQSQLLAKSIGHAAGIPTDVSLLKRSRATPSQGTLGRKKRFTNVNKAFAVPEKAKERLKGQSILLVDDVLTTGATVSACAAVLKAAGAARVDIIVFARVGEPVAA